MQANQFRKSTTSTLIALFEDDKTPLSAGAAWFPDVYTTDKDVEIEVQRNLYPIAVDVMRGTGGNLNKFSKSTEKIYEPPYFEEYFVYNQLKRYDIIFQMLRRGADPVQLDAAYLIAQGYKEAIRLRDKIERAKELQRWQALTTGIVTMKNGDNINFKRLPASTVTLTGANRWTQKSTCVPLTDFETGAKFIRQKGRSSGENVIDVIFGSNAYTNFRSSEQALKDATFQNGVKRVDINMPKFDAVSGLTYQGRIGGTDYIYDMWTYNDSYDDIANDTTVDYLDTDTVVMIARDFKGVHAHAGVPAIIDDGTNTVIVPFGDGPYYARDYVDQVKKNWIFEVSSAPLPVPISIDRVYTIKTTSNS